MARTGTRPGPTRHGSCHGYFPLAKRKLMHPSCTALPRPPTRPGAPALTRTPVSRPGPGVSDCGHAERPHAPAATTISQLARPGDRRDGHAAATFAARATTGAAPARAVPVNRPSGPRGPPSPGCSGTRPGDPGSRSGRRLGYRIPAQVAARRPAGGPPDRVHRARPTQAHCTRPAGACEVQGPGPARHARRRFKLCPVSPRRSAWGPASDSDRGQSV
jgi:hypothetical protein